MNNEILDHFIEIEVVKKYNELDYYPFWINPRNVVSFDIDQLVKYNSKEKYKERLLNSIVEETPDKIISDYLVSFMDLDFFNNQHTNNFQTNVFIMIDAAVYLIRTLHSPHVGYPFSLSGSYLLNNDNYNYSFEIICNNFFSENDEHLKRLLSVFAFEIIYDYKSILSTNNKEKYDLIYEYINNYNDVYY